MKFRSKQINNSQISKLGMKERTCHWFISLNCSLGLSKEVGKQKQFLGFSLEKQFRRKMSIRVNKEAMVSYIFYNPHCLC